MVTEFYAPVRAPGCVESFFTLKNDGAETSSELILPDGTVGLLFLDCGEIQRSQGPGQVSALRVCHLFGQKSQAAKYHIGSGALSAFGVKLRPHVLFEIFNIEGHELSDAVLEADQIPSFQLNALTESVCESSTVNHKIALVEQFLLSHRNMQDTQLAVCNSIIDHIIMLRGNVRMREIQYKFNIHYKKLERLFKRYVGLTPKHYARIIRLSATMYYHSQPGVYNLTDLTYASGYFDQMHFIRDVKMFTGVLPSQLYRTDPCSIERAHRDYLIERFGRIDN